MITLDLDLRSLARILAAAQPHHQVTDEPLPLMRTPTTRRIIREALTEKGSDVLAGPDSDQDRDRERAVLAWATEQVARAYPELDHRP
ncbi:hypothetical protein [Streptacidiphilus sp. EB103A]|uniref:hypothetical protein n=1 Tax=Streptacidiphilus sp. EB103A TaxID=3156275 RepID=UPI003516C236